MSIINCCPWNIIIFDGEHQQTIKSQYVLSLVYKSTGTRNKFKIGNVSVNVHDFDSRIIAQDLPPTTPNDTLIVTCDVGKYLRKNPELCNCSVICPWDISFEYAPDCVIYEFMKFKDADTKK